MICPNCGNSVEEGSMFCDQCGQKIPVPSQPANQTAATPQATPQATVAAQPVASPQTVAQPPVTSTQQNTSFIEDVRKFTNHPYVNRGGFLSFSSVSWLIMGIIRFIFFGFIGASYVYAAVEINKQLGSVKSSASDIGSMLGNMLGSSNPGSGAINNAVNTYNNMLSYYWFIGVTCIIFAIFACVMCVMLFSKIRTRSYTFVNIYFIYVIVSAVFFLVFSIYTSSLLSNVNQIASDLLKLGNGFGVNTSSVSYYLGAFMAISTTLFFIIFIYILLTGFLRLYYFGKSVRLRTYMGTDVYAKRNPITRKLATPYPLGEELDDAQNAQIIATCKLKPIKVVNKTSNNQTFSQNVVNNANTNIVCPNCKKQLKAGTKFCDECGQRL